MGNEKRDTDTGAADVTLLIRNQKLLLESVQKTLTNFKKDTNDRKNEVYYRKRLANLERYANEFYDNHKCIILKVADSEMYVQTSVYDQFDEAYLEACSKIEGDFSKAFPPAQSPLDSTVVSNQSISDSSNRHLNNVRLPKLNMPTFGGDCLQWPSFFDAFQAIHVDSSLPGVQKLRYLKSLLTDSAELLIRHVPITDENYALAITELQKTYDNIRIIFTDQLNKYFNQPAIRNENQTEIQELLSVSRATMHGTTKLGATLESVFVHMTLQKLPSETRVFCLQSFPSRRIPTWSDLEEAVLTRISSLPCQQINQNKASQNSNNTVYSRNAKVKSNNAVSSNTFHTTQANTCPKCDDVHSLRNCPVFYKTNVKERRTAVERFKRCFNCLGSGHIAEQCPSQRGCRMCGRRHHTLLHLPSDGSVQIRSGGSTPSTSEVAQIPSSVANYTVNTSTHSKQILLATAILTIRNNHQQFVKIRALLDQGSQATLITEAAVQRLGLAKTSIRAQIHGVGSGPANQSKGLVTVNLGSCYSKEFQITTNALVLSKLTACLPTHHIDVTGWDHIQNLQLADPNFMQPNHIDLLLGADVYADLLRPGICRGESISPTAQNTVLGWILSGTVQQTNSPSVNITNFHTQVEIDTMLRKFWELEEVPNERVYSKEDEWCETFFKETCKRQSNGKYLVQLPLKTYCDPEAVLGSSKRQAVQRFFHLERRLNSNPKLREEYSAVIQEYLDLGQMESDETDEKELLNNKLGGYEGCYLPHHAVIKESSTTTKLRVVFDASAKSSNGRSLNSILVTGPPLQTDLIHVILNWRCLRYVFTADIEKMYRRIDVGRRDTNYQKIIWRPDSTAELKTYRLNTVTFGTASAPYTAIRVMHQLAEDEENTYPLAAQTIRHEMYVDDILSGDDDIPTALKRQGELIKCLDSGEFKLRKWASNSPELIAEIPEEHREAKADFQVRTEALVKALGLYWNPGRDEFGYKINFELQKTAHTKRSVLSTIARLFDPLGWINPIIISAKIFLKQLWCRGLDWDDPIPSDLTTIWLAYLASLRKIGEVNIPRWVNSAGNNEVCELHTFCDGSLQAYAAATYLRIKNQHEETFIHLMMGKSKVSPKQQITVPRLELCGAVLAVKLHRVIKSTLQVKFKNIISHFWTDSTIVLAWLKGDPERWKTFVCNRVTTILKNTNISQWHHVSSGENPADISSRGATVDQLSQNELWWHGPHWLREDAHRWPKSASTESSEIKELSQPETKKGYIINSSTIAAEECIIKRFSAFTKLIKITGWCLRFIRNAQTKPPQVRQTSDYITRDEFQAAKLCLQRKAQGDEFLAEISALKNEKQLPPKSKLIGLNPFLDRDGILRVGGRLKNSLLGFQEKHPIILPALHHFTRLYIEHCHTNCLHGGIQLTLNCIRKTCWIPQGRRVVGSQLRKCHRCFKTKPIPSNQLMGDLPHARVRPSRPFTATGVDYAGPIDFRVSKGRGNKSYKGYIAVFVCLSTKAIHLEAVSDLSTHAFLAALQRFFARRGLAKDMYSDCGRNFVGANNQLLKNMSVNRTLVEREVLPILASQQVAWHFIPPFSPHFGGLWEAGVKSVKYHLKRIIPNSTLTFEEISTVLCRIESCLNSRPLCPLSEQHEDFAVLTPGHFLIGDSLLSPPEQPEENLLLTNRWHQLQKITWDFWKSWSREYLSRLQMRPKWSTSNHNIKIGDLVVIKQDNLPPNFWKLGRILQLHYGTDGLARVATLKTQDGTFKRPVTKICILPAESDDAVDSSPTSV